MKSLYEGYPSAKQPHFSEKNRIEFFWREEKAFREY